MGPIQAVKSGFKRYVDFEGRSSRSEYWWWQLFFILFLIGPPFFVGALGLSENWMYLSGVFFLATFIPNIAITIRRLHDSDKSGWLYLTSLIPYVGGLILIVLCCLRGTNGANRFGEDPLQPTGENLQEVFS